MVILLQGLPVEKGSIQTVGVLSYLFPRSETHNHQGIDIPQKVGTPVRSVTSGLVVDANNELAEHFSGYGKVVQIQFVDTPLKPVYILYAHLNTVDVKPGDEITQGQQIGTVGNSCFSRSDPTARCNGSHLHFEVRTEQYLPTEGGRLDPIVFLSQYGQISSSDLMKIKTEEKKRNRQIMLIGVLSISAISYITYRMVKS